MVCRGDGDAVRGFSSRATILSVPVINRWRYRWRMSSLHNVYGAVSQLICFAYDDRSSIPSWTASWQSARIKASASGYRSQNVAGAAACRKGRHRRQGIPIRESSGAAVLGQLSSLVGTCCHRGTIEKSNLLQALTMRLLVDFKAPS